MNFCQRGKNRIQTWRFWIFVNSCLAIFIITLGSFILTDHEKEFINEFYLEGMIDGELVKFRIWENQAEGMYYLFLPACYSNEEIYLTIHTGGNKIVRINDMTFKDNDVWGKVENNVIYHLNVKNFLGMQYIDKPFQVLVSENLPAVFINVEAMNLLEEDFENKKYIETGEILLVDAGGNVDCLQQLERFKIRGNLTATLEKKPYSFTLSEESELCNMASARNWKLLANATDGSYVRNKLVLDMANQVTDAYEPDGEFVELFLNGEYQGLYLLTEGIEIGENRLETHLKGEWLLEMELDFRMEEDISYVVTERGQLFAINAEKMVFSNEVEFIESLLNDVESALYSGDSVSVLSGKRLDELIDMDSWADAWLIEEISGDHDAGIASQFAYIHEDGRLYAGPVWDFDGTMGNVNTTMFRIPEALITSIENTRPVNNANQNRWLSAMYQNKEFQEILKKKYSEIFEPILSEMCNKKISEYTNAISRSASLDALRWNENRLSWVFVLPKEIEIRGEGDFRRYDTLNEQIKMVQDFLERKNDFLNSLWIEQKEFCVVEVRDEAPFLNSDYNNTLYYWIEKDKPFLDKPIETDDYYEFVGYVKVNDNTIIQEGTAVQQNCVLKSVWKEKGE